ncbi:unnamed protein product [Nezara viridula]|uniref:Uncharacterized protein n=1 Tax=Nezara viridula TaxID=85310 RepID=A0A9P0HKH8_NEZVI|nr:unnamed protein product [Nezara viridula]
MNRSTLSTALKFKRRVATAPPRSAITRLEEEGDPDDYDGYVTTDKGPSSVSRRDNRSHMRRPLLQQLNDQ